MRPFKCRTHGITEAYDYGQGEHRRRTCKVCRARRVKELWRRIKLETITAYGGRCVCCGEREPDFLTIDHTAGNGREHRKTVGRGHRLYEWLKKQAFPKKGYALLCFNCNCAKGQFGTCPHQRR